MNTALVGAFGRLFTAELEKVHAALEHLGFTGPNVAAATEAWEGLRQWTGAPQDQGPIPASKPAPPGKRAPSILTGAGGDAPLLKTGQWATQQPHRQQMVPPCNHVCPAGNDVQGFVQALAGDRPDEALEILLRTSPFPGVCGRVCPAPCMDNCNRIALDSAVNVRQLERYAAEHGVVESEPHAERDERVAVVGSGPAGLTAAYHLARFGYRVTVHEAGDEVGGLLRTGIPGFRLPQAVVDQEIGRVLGLGVEVVTGKKVDREALLEVARSSDAVLVATGLQEMRSLDLATGGSDGVVQGIEFLERVHEGTARLDGERVIVVGGGNTAMDSARSALRVGAEEVRLVYRRTTAEMPAIREEIDEALEEGVQIAALTQPVTIRPDEQGSNGNGSYVLTCRQMKLGEPDSSGRARPIPVPDSDFDLACDRVILALGQSADLGVFPEGTEVREGERLVGLLETPVFAIGDLATGEGTVAGAIGSGRRSALHIHEALSGELLEGDGHRASRRPVDVWSDEVIHPEAMKLHLFERNQQTQGATLESDFRTWNFDEIHDGLEDAGEAGRCLSCGVCNECDRCVTYCPEGLLKRVGSTFHFDYSFCKGCGVCAVECPRNVIFMSQL